MKKWIRIAECYDGGFTEFYFELHNEINLLKLKETSYHYNAKKETLLSEIYIPTELKSYDEIVEFISVNTPERYGVDLITLKENIDLYKFIMNRA